MKPYVDRNVGHQLRYIKMNVGHAVRTTQPPILVFRYICKFTLAHCTLILSLI